MRRWLILLLAGVLGLFACARSVRVADLDLLYSRAAQSHGPERNPVIVIPGLLGTRLEEVGTGRVVWGSFDGDYAHPKRPADVRLIALPLRRGRERPAVRTAGVIDRFRASVLGIPVYREAYNQILSILGAGGYRDEQLAVSGAVDYGDRHFTCFQFDYDWRLGVVENAARLDGFIRQKKRYVEDEIRRRFGVAEQDVRFDVLAHSLGGLVLRYYLRYGARPLPADGSLPELDWAGSPNVERALLVSTPNAGTIRALEQLVRGVRYGPFAARYDAAIVSSFPAAYELLARVRHGAYVDAADPSQTVDVFDPELWQRLSWGLADPARDRMLAWLLPDVADPGERRRIALDRLRRGLERAALLHRALDLPASPPPGTELYLIAGDSVPTAAAAAIDLGSGEFEIFRRAPGDGRVLRTSALMDERVAGTWQPRLKSPIDWRGTLFLFRDHLGITKDPEFADNVLYRLLEEPRQRPGP